MNNIVEEPFAADVDVEGRALSAPEFTTARVIGISAQQVLRTIGQTLASPPYLERKAQPLEPVSLYVR